MDGIGFAKISTFAKIKIAILIIEIFITIIAPVNMLEKLNNNRNNCND